MPKFNEAQGAWEPEEHEIDGAAEQASLLRALSNAPAQPAPQPNPILFHPDLVDREFGSHLLAVPKLAEWAAKQGLEVVTHPPIGGFQFVQVEAFLCAIENAARENTPEPMAAAIVQATPHLAHDRAAEVTPRWLVGADAHMQWRRLLERAVEAGELVLLHFGSKLPVEARTEPQTAPVVAESANNGPLPLTTGDIAFCFDGIRWNEQQWRKPLGDKPKWLQSCVAIPGQRGVSETRWNPVLIAAALVHNGHAQARSIRAKFQTKPLLKDWLEAWKTYEADNFGTQ